LIVIAVIAGAWAWISTLLRKGIMVLIGFDRICVQQFETVLLYRNGRFEKALPPAGTESAPAAGRSRGSIAVPKSSGSTRAPFRRTALPLPSSMS
jgi:hypothetical protein